jgi:hypothetical protein
VNSPAESWQNSKKKKKKKKKTGKNGGIVAEHSICQGVDILKELNVLFGVETGHSRGGFGGMNRHFVIKDHPQE